MSIITWGIFSMPGLLVALLLAVHWIDGIGRNPKPKPKARDPKRDARRAARRARRLT